VISISGTSIKPDIDTYIPLKIIMNAENKTAGENRNTAVEHSKGEIISFIDADDTMRKDRLEILLRMFSEFECNAVLHHFSENKSQPCRDYSAGLVVRYQYDERIHFGHPTLKRQILLETSYTAKPRGQDVELIDKVIKKYNNIYVYADCLTAYMSNQSTFY
jgi:glycosyltransferase involved in cell wall biosynthesis